MGDWLKKPAGDLYHIPVNLSRAWSLRGSTSPPRSDQALGKLLYQRIADVLPALPGTMTAVHLGERHIHQDLDDPLDWMCAKFLDTGGPPRSLSSSPRRASSGYRPTSAGFDAQQLTPESIPCTESEIELLLTLARLAAYNCHRRRSSPPAMTFFRI